ncbi:chorismate mutase [Paenibacillus kobensis]|uniref:chorismate mutase n=1 Tax=Paenibacillus kobensis TaxID=59841 RepID=UPI000FDC8D2A|nr:chorismate mutase [Paenibacillus kobensis]
MATLEDLRKQIDQLDEQIIERLAQRFKLIEEVGKIKAKEDMNVQDVDRESRIFNKVEHLAERYGMDSKAATQLYRQLMDLVIIRHQEIRRDAASTRKP